MDRLNIATRNIVTRRTKVRHGKSYQDQTTKVTLKKNQLLHISPTINIFWLPTLSFTTPKLLLVTTFPDVGQASAANQMIPTWNIVKPDKQT
jgi:hypothetical protein